MFRLLLILALQGAFCQLLVGQVEKNQTSQRFAQSFVAMGVEFRIVAYAFNRPEFDLAAKRVQSHVQMLESIFSDYNPNSEAMRLCRNTLPGKSITVSAALYDVLVLSKRIHEKTNSAFDPTIGQVTKIWRMARKRNRLPNDDQIRNAMSSVGFGFVSILPDQKVEIEKLGMRLDFGGIAKGYAADESVRIFSQLGFKSVLVDAGGDIRVSDAPPGKSGWLIGIRMIGENEIEKTPKLSLANCAVATSGDAIQRLVKNGVRHSHVVDPRTGLAVTNSNSVTVVADDGATADALASAFCVLDSRIGIKLAEQMPNVQAAIVSGEANQEIVNCLKREGEPSETKPRFVITTDGFNRLFADPTAGFGD